MGLIDAERWEEAIYGRLHDFYSLTYDEERNSIIKNFPLPRELKVEVKDMLDVKGYHVINAYSIYEPHTDHIVITEKFIDVMSEVLLNGGFEEYRAAWMLYVEIMFCSFHEFGHLLIGHCQLCNNMKMAVVESAKDESGLEKNVLQALETDADLFAGRRIADLTATYIYSNKMRMYDYTNWELFYYDMLRGIRAFFFILEILEFEESKRLHKVAVETGKDEKEIIRSAKRNNHPPTIFRGYCVGETMMAYLSKYFGIEGKRRKFIEIFIYGEKYFGGSYLRMKTFWKIYKHLLNGSVADSLERIKCYYTEELAGELKKYSRLPLEWRRDIC